MIPQKLEEEHLHGWMQKFPTIGACTSHQSSGSQKYSKVLVILRQQHFKARSGNASKVIDDSLNN